MSVYLYEKGGRKRFVGGCWQAFGERSCVQAADCEIGMDNETKTTQFGIMRKV